MQNEASSRLRNRHKLLTITQAAQFLNISPDTLRRWEDKGMITPHRTKGGSRRYTFLDLKIAKLSKKKGWAQKYINMSRHDLKIALFTSMVWIAVLIIWHFLSPVLLKPTNFTEANPSIPTLIRNK